VLNKVLLIGRLTTDPVIKALPSGKRVANFTLAIDNPGKDQSGAPLPADLSIVWPTATIWCACWTFMWERVA